MALEVDLDATSPAHAGSLPVAPDRRRVRHVVLRVLGETALMLLPLAPYQLLTMLPEPAAPAVAHGWQILTLERQWGLDVERDLFTTTTAHPGLFAAAHAYYEVGHFAGVAIAALLLAWLAPARWPVMRTGFVAATLLGLVIFRLDPTAPPNLLPGTVFATVPTKNPPDPFAAMPSEHIAWTVWALVATLLAAQALLRDGRGSRTAVRCAAAALALLGVLHLALMVLVIFATAHHFVLDAAAGALDLAVGLALAAGLHHLLRARRRRGGPVVSA
jgi:hypothetical protein